MLTYLHQVINKCDTNSGEFTCCNHSHAVLVWFKSHKCNCNWCLNFKGPFGKSIELIEKIILSLKDEQDILRKLPILPVLTDVLLRSPVSRNEYVLKLIQDVSFGIVIKTCQPFIERLIKFCVKQLCNDEIEVGIRSFGFFHYISLKNPFGFLKSRLLFFSLQSMQIVALSVLINLCSKNAILLNTLQEQINLIDLQKKIPLQKYGILVSIDEMIFCWLHDIITYHYLIFSDM